MNRQCVHKGNPKETLQISVSLSHAAEVFFRLPNLDNAPEGHGVEHACCHCRSRGQSRIDHMRVPTQLQGAVADEGAREPLSDNQQAHGSGQSLDNAE